VTQSPLILRVATPSNAAQQSETRRTTAQACCTGTTRTRWPPRLEAQLQRLAFERASPTSSSPKSPTSLSPSRGRSSSPREEVWRPLNSKNLNRDSEITARAARLQQMNHQRMAQLAAASQFVTTAVGATERRDPAPLASISRTEPAVKQPVGPAGRGIPGKWQRAIFLKISSLPA
jgi:hypothetical protein